MTMAGLAAVFWGSMGVAGQYLLQNCHFTPMDLISIRMLLAGSIFVGIEFFLLKRGALKVFETKQNIRQLPAFFYSLPRGSLKTATVA